jgi:hypothetical protein
MKLLVIFIILSMSMTSFAQNSGEADTECIMMQEMNSRINPKAEAFKEQNVRVKGKVQSKASKQ